MKSAVKKILPILGIALLVNITGCATFQDTPKLKTRLFKKDKPVNKVGEDLIKAFVKDDAEGFLKILPDVVREEYGVNGFKATRKSMIEQLGKPISYSFVLNLEHPKFTISVWKIRYHRKSFDKQKDIYQESLFRAVSGKINGKEKLLSFNFF